MASGSGHQVTLRATICNAGVVKAKAFEITFLAASPFPQSCKPDLPGVLYERVPLGLQPKACVTKEVGYGNVTKSMPYDQAWVRADGLCEVVETKEGNNIKSGGWNAGAKGPDLVIDSFTAMPDGPKVTYKVKVCNTGKQLATPFTLNLYYNRATDLAGCLAIPGISPPAVAPDDSFRFIAGLVSGACETKTFIQNGAAKGSYTARVLVDAKCEVTETNELDNDEQALYGVSQLYPDLYIEHSHSPYLPEDGSEASHLLYIYNKGASTTAPIVVGLYYTDSTDPQCGATPDIITTFNGLKAGDTKSRKMTRPGPIPPGRYTYLAKIDLGCTIQEEDETNNYVMLPSTSGPDLKIDSLKASVSGTKATYTVALSSSQKIGPFNLGIYYNKGNTAPDCKTLPNETYRFTTGLAAAETSAVTFTRTGITGGSYTVWARVDSKCEVAEYDETNNNRKVTHIVGKADLSIAKFSALPFDNQVNYSVTICNYGQSITKSFKLGLFYHKSSQPGCSAIPDQTSPVPLNPFTGVLLASGQCTTRTFVAPAATTMGNYTAWILADSGCSVTEFNETNNTASSSYTVGPISPNLTVSSLSASVSGSDVTYSVTACNAGKAIAPGTPFDLGLYYNRTVAPSCSVTPSDKVTISTGLGYNACVTRTFKRSNVPAGVYTAWAVADPGCKISELSEIDNSDSKLYIVGTTTKPELRVSKMNVQVSGTTATYNVKVCNAGAKSGPFSLGLYYHGASSPPCNSSPDSVYNVTSLARETCLKRAFVRTGATTGSFTARAHADYKCAISEANEVNNHRAVAYTVIKFMPDLVVRNMQVSSLGGKTTLEATVCNEGTAVAAASSLGLFVSSKTQPGCSVTPTVSLAIKSLAPAGCQTLSAISTSPAPGAHVAWALVDAKCAVTESDETNNTAARTYQIAVPPPLPPGDAGVSDAGVSDAGVSDAGAVFDGPLGDADGPQPDLPGGPDAMASDGALVDAGPRVDLPTASPDVAVGVDIGPGTPDAGGVPNPSSDDGGCRLGGAHEPSPPAWILLLLVGLALRRRRRS
ncbi:MAG: hypothetical protein KAI47_00500 [Deltaproteobacteria bacterium]|nr:hypothetical protein [Deltaproteobacteria bacterium]